MTDYRTRITDALLARKLQTAGAVLIEGPKWCGKTTTAEQFAKSKIYIDEPTQQAANIKLAEIDPASLLIGETPRLLDEWQLAPELWDSVRFTVDHRDGFGQFILTGSAVPPATDKIHHSGTGRFSRLRMRTMSLHESGDSSSEVSLEALFNQQPIRGINKLDLARVAFLVCRGGWPAVLQLSDDLSLDLAYDYVDLVKNSDLSRTDNVHRSPATIARLLKAYARGQATQTTIQHFCEDMITNEFGVTTKTVSKYIDALKRIFVIEDVAAWNPNLRSRTAIRASDTHYFVDPSIAVAALNTGPKELVKPENLELLGQLFETLCIRDLKIYAESLGGEVQHYRDSNGLECDAVIHRRNGQYGLAEIKLGGNTATEQAVATLKKLRDKINTDIMPEPAFLMVVSGTEPYAYRRKDGIYVVPIGCLRN